MAARLTTIPSVDAIAGLSIVAAVGDFSRSDDPDKLVAYVGLSGLRRAQPEGCGCRARSSGTGFGNDDPGTQDWTGSPPGEASRVGARH
jgi:hypothetical protein